MSGGALGGWLWIVIDVAMVAALAAVVIYGMLRVRSRSPRQMTQTEEGTRELYRREDRGRGGAAD